eukprot:scaffold8051_cov114-Isochrysis_galbana.AAC.4
MAAWTHKGGGCAILSSKERCRAVSTAARAARRAYLCPERPHRSPRLPLSSHPWIQARRPA